MSGEVQAPGRQQAADVVGERDVADQQDYRAIADGGRSECATRRCRRCRWRRGWRRREGQARGPRRTARRRGSASRRRRTASRRAAATLPGGGDQRLGQLVAQRLRDHVGGVVIGPAPRREPVRIDGRLRGVRVERGCRISGVADGDHRGRILPGPLGVQRDLLGPLERRKPGAKRLGRREVADPDHELGLHLLGEPLVAQDHVVVGDRGRSVARARQRIGEQRVTRPLGEPRRRRPQPAVTLVAARDHDPAARRAVSAPAGGGGLHQGRGAPMAGRRPGRCRRPRAATTAPAARAAGS